MGTYETAIGVVAATGLILLLFIGLHVTSELRDRREMYLGLIGVFAGMVICFFWLRRFHVNVENSTVVMAVAGVIMVADLSVCLRFTKPRPSGPTWLHISVWAVLANSLPLVILAYLSLP
jgi:hypothetical protein